MLDSNFWKNYFKVYDALNLLIPYQELLETICQELEIKPGEKILEAGCGTGNLALKIKEGGAKVIGLDNCKEALDIYRKKDPTAELVLADLTEKLPFPDNHFDKIASNNTIYTLPKEKQLEIMKEFYRVLKPNGKIVLGNLKKKWKPGKIYIEGIKRDLEKNGFFLTFLKVFRLTIPTIKILFYNQQIKKESQYYFFDLNEQKKLLERTNFKNITETKIIYAGQSLLNNAHKK